MHIELWSIGRVVPYEKNPRINAGAVDAVAKSIQTFGFRQPIVVDRDGVIVVGHTRWLAAKQIGLAEVPVHVAVDLTPAQAKAYRIADNATNEIAEWNLDLLPLELADLKALEFDLDLLGFGQDELAKLMGAEATAGLVDPDDIPAPPDAATTQPGDLILLGTHRLLCGDSSKSEDVDRLLDGQPVHLVNTDPPYNVKVEPRSNNAIAAGNSSFANPNKHHQKFDLERHPGKSKPTQKKLRAKDRPLANDFMSGRGVRQDARRLVREHRSCAATRSGAVLLGWLRQLRKLPAGPQTAWSVLLAGDYLGEGTPGADEKGLHGQSRVVFLLLERRLRACVPGTKQRRRRVVRKEDQSAVDDPFDGKTDGTRRSCHAILVPRRRECPRSIRRFGQHLNCRRATRPQSVLDGT
jgi:hypothetical protein